jgi:SAM-dependent methyltransferase
VDVIARYDGVAEWYDRELAPFVDRYLPALRDLLGSGTGRCLDLGCGTGRATATVCELGWRVTGVDLSADQLRVAAERLGGRAELVRADAASLPFADGSFDAVVSTFTHTDLDDFAATVAEAARVLRAGGVFAYLGLHPCFVGPHSRFEGATGTPELHPGYGDTRRYSAAPGVVNPDGLRARVTALHLPLATLVQSFLGAGLRVERFEELGGGDYPAALGLRLRRP